MVLAARDGRPLHVTTDLVEDAIALRVGEVEPKELCRTSSPVLMLAAVAAFVDNKVALTILHETVRPLMPEATLERWFPGAEIDQIATRRPGGWPGGPRGLLALQATSAEGAAAVQLPPGAAAPGEVTCARQNQSVVLAMSARVFRHPVPTWSFEQFRRPPEVPVEGPLPTEPIP